MAMVNQFRVVAKKTTWAPGKLTWFEGANAEPKILHKHASDWKVIKGEKCYSLKFTI